jgi:hypothetical protein
VTLPVQHHLHVPGIQDPHIRYRWDDWNVEQVDLPLKDTLQKRLNRISKRAIAAFTIGTAEWIVFRFALLSEDRVPTLRLEAAWAQEIALPYSSNQDIALDDWRGPVRGPIGIALRRVIFAVDQASRDGDPAWRAGRAAKLAKHVITDPSMYLKWRERILERFEKLYPLNPDDTLGEVVPREALDPDAEFDVSQTEALINRFLAGLDYRSNPFLNPPHAMLEAGFEGTPYSFDINEDRKARFEW